MRHASVRILTAMVCIGLLVTSATKIAYAEKGNSAGSANRGMLATKQGAEATCPVALNWLMTAPRFYYMVYGYWPETWGHLGECGLFTNELRSASGEIINPHDQQFSFIGDIHYMYKGEQDNPVLAIAEPLQDGTMRIRYEIVQDTISYAQVYSTPLEGVDANYNSQRVKLAGEVLRRHQVAMMYQVKYAQGMFLQVNGRYGSWVELHEAGMMPIKPETINPQTGKPWSGDGSPNDLAFELRQDGAYSCLLTDQHGQTPWRLL